MDGALEYWTPGPQESLEHDLEFRFSPAPGVSSGEKTGDGHLNLDFTWQIWLVGSTSTVIASLQ